MPAYPVRALVLRKTKLGESDTIVTLLAEDGRQVRAVAKGARKTMSRLGVRLEPFVVADLLLHTGRNLDIVAEARTVQSHEALRADFDRVAAGSVIADVADKLAVEGQAEERLFALCLASLDAIELAPPEALDALVAAFLVKAISMHGLRPQLSSCAACAGALAPGARFSAAQGGAVCPDCGQLDPSAPPLSPEARDLLAALLQARLADVPALAPPPDVVAEALRLLRAFITYHVPARLKALEFFLSQPRP